MLSLCLEPSLHGLDVVFLVVAHPLVAQGDLFGVGFQIQIIGGLCFLVEQLMKIRDKFFEGDSLDAFDLETGHSHLTDGSHFVKYLSQDFVHPMFKDIYI
jgi:hypothetical protein